MAGASKVSGEKYRRIFSEYDPVFLGAVSSAALSCNLNFSLKKKSCGSNVRYDWFSASMCRQMILDPLSPALRDTRGGPELDYGKMEGEIGTEQFMEEIRKYDCLFNRFSKEFKEKFKKINAWSKVGEVFSISPAAAEKKFRNVRTACGRDLKGRKNVPSGSGRNAVPIPREFVNLEWLSVHIELNGKSRTRLSLITAIGCDHM